MTKTLFALLISLCLTVVVHGQSLDEQKLDAFAHAVALTEGFGTPHTVPTRYHNPGDIRAHKGVHYPGQVGLNRHGYVIFKDDAAGFAALKDQLRTTLEGQSKHYNVDMTITQVAKLYATKWRVWAKNVSKHLDVPPSTTLRAYFELPPDIHPKSDGKALKNLLAHTPAMPNLYVSPFEKAQDELMYANDQDNLQRQTNCI